MERLAAKVLRGTCVVAAIALGAACGGAEPEVGQVGEALSGTDLTKTGSVRPGAVDVPFNFEQFDWDGRLFFGSGGGRELKVGVFRPSGIALSRTALPTMPRDVASTSVQIADPLGHLDALAANQEFSHFSVSQDPTTTNLPNPRRCDASGAYGGIASPGDHDCYRLRVYMAVNTGGDNSRQLYQFSASVVVRAYDAAAATAPRISRTGAVPLTANQIVKFAVTSPILPVKYMASGKLVQHAGRFELTSTADARLVLSRRTEVEYTFNFRPGAPGEGWSEPRFITQMHSDPTCIDPLSGVTSVVEPYTKPCPTGKLRLGQIYPLGREPMRDALGRECTNGLNDVGCSMTYPWISQDGSELFYARVKQYVTTPGPLLNRAGQAVVGARTGYVQKYIDGPANRCRLLTSNLPTSPGLVPSMWNAFSEIGDDKGFPYSRGRHVYPVFSREGYGEVDFVDSSESYAAFFKMNEVLEQAPTSDVERSTCRDGVCYEARVSHTLTPDTSGHFNTGRLESADGNPAGAARFPGEYLKYPGESVPRSQSPNWSCDSENDADENRGFVGRAVYFPPTGVVRVPAQVDATPVPKFANADPSWLALDRAEGVTIELATRLLDTNVKQLPLFTKGDLVAIRLQQANDPTKFFFSFGARPSAASPYMLVTSGLLDRSQVTNWMHLAVTVKPQNGALAVTMFLRAVDPADPSRALASSASGSIALAAIPEDGKDLLLGPGVPGLQSQIGVTARTMIALVDEVGISRGIRGRDFIARAGYLESTVDGIVSGDALGAALASSGLTPPVGLRPSEMRIPADVKTLIDQNRFDQAVALGRSVFNDRTLTEQSTPIACATCHAPGKAFVDARVGTTSFGVNGDTGLNAPTLLNRAFSIRQFFDTRSTDLVDQALDPIVSSVEMGGTVAGALAHVRRSPYAPTLSALRSCGGTVTCFPDARLLALALTAFELRQMSGGKVVDHLDAGDRASALAAIGGDQARLDRIISGKTVFEGKGRCRSCHVGSTFSDEMLHNTGLSTGATPSRGGRMKTSTLRALPMTAPYFHDGSAPTLDAVLDHYIAGTAHADAIGTPDFEFRPTPLTAVERDQLKAFLEAM